MFNELTRELLDLTGSTRGEIATRFAAVQVCCSSSCCTCLFLCW
jgi:hypothetical protein